MNSQHWVKELGAQRFGMEHSGQGGVTELFCSSLPCLTPLPVHAWRVRYLPGIRPMRFTTNITAVNGDPNCLDELGDW